MLSPMLQGQGEGRERVRRGQGEGESKTNRGHVSGPIAF